MVIWIRISESSGCILLSVLGRSLNPPLRVPPSFRSFSTVRNSVNFVHIWALGENSGFYESGRAMGTPSKRGLEDNDRRDDLFEVS